MPRPLRNLAAYWVGVFTCWTVAAGVAPAAERHAPRQYRPAVQAAASRAGAAVRPPTSARTYYGPPEGTTESAEVVMPYEGEIYGGEFLEYASCGPAGACAPMICGDTTWVELEFLLWWRDSRSFPPLVTSGDPGTLPLADVLFGGDLDEQARPGGRLNFGWWIDSCQYLGIGGRFVSAGEAENVFSVDSNQAAFIARPFFDVAPGINAQDAQVIINTEIGQTGSLDLASTSEFIAADAYLRCLWLQGACTRVDFIFGYQFGRIDEGLRIDTLSVNPDFGTLSVSDSFATENEFHGGHFGVQSEYRWGCWGVDLLAKVGFGNMRQRASLIGSRTGSTGQSGLLVQEATNAGDYQQDESAYMHDVGLKLAYFPVERLKLSVGYSMMFFSDVLRAGEQVDLNVDSRLFTATTPPQNVTQPAFPFNSSDFFIHGVNLGLECRF